MVNAVQEMGRISRQCQVPYGRVIDFGRLLRTLTVVYERAPGDKQYIALGIHEKGRVAAECVAFARYAMFSQVYWHHTSRICKAMLHHAVWEWLAGDRRSNDQKKTELHQFVLQRERSGPSARGALPLFGEAAVVGHSRQPDWSQIHPGDRAILQWIHTKTSPMGQRLIDDLAGRRLYKRLAVITHDTNKDLWDDLQSIRKDFKQVLALSRKLREKLAQRAELELEEARAKAANVRITGGRATDLQEALEALRIDGSILVDIPVQREAATEKLRYYPEAAHRLQRDEFDTFPNLEESSVWSLLAEKLHTLSAKIRVVADPRISVLARAKRPDKEDPILGQHNVEADLASAATEL